MNDAKPRPPFVAPEAREPTVHELSLVVLARIDVAELVPLRTLVRNYVHLAVEKCGGNKTHAAQVLGISRRSLYRKLDGVDDDAG